MADGRAEGTISVPELVSFLVDLAERSGEIVREVADGGNLGIVDKGGELDRSGAYVADVQTAADRTIEEMCVAELSSAFPSLCVVAEESADCAAYPEPPHAAPSPPVRPPQTEAARAALAADWPRHLNAVDPSRVCLYIDPLDGTGEYAAGNLWAVTNLFGVCVDGVPVAGVINHPYFEKEAAGAGGEEAQEQKLGRTVWGGPGAGVHGLGRATEPAPAPPPLVVGTNRVVRDDRIEGALAAVGTDESSRVSASGWNTLKVLEGAHHLLLVTRNGTKKWDTAPGEALLRAKGGVLTDAVGRAYTYGLMDGHMNECGVLAALDPELHATSSKLVREKCSPWPLDVQDSSV